MAEPRSSEDDYDSAFIENGEHGKDLTLEYEFFPHVWAIFFKLITNC